MHEYIERHAKVLKRETSRIEDERLLNKDVIPAWGDRKAKDIRKRDVVLLLESVLERGPALSNNILKVTRKMFNFGVERDMLGHKKTGVVKISNRHKYDNEKKKALEAWERKLKRITSGKGSGNVIPIITTKNKASAAG
jgi:hypothetical protein